MEETEEVENSIKILPKIKVNTYNTMWLKERTYSKDYKDLKDSKEIEENVVRTNSKTNLKTDYFNWNYAEETKKLSKDNLEEDLCPKFILYCECGSLCDLNETLCKECLEEQNCVEYSGHLFFYMNEKLKPCFVRLLNKELYCIFIKNSSL